MKIFKGLINLISHLTKEKNQVSYEEVQSDEPENPQTQEETSKLETAIENPYVNQVREWAMKKIDLLHEADRHRNAKALAAEFDEWINIPEGTDELHYLCLEDEEWTDDQEIDIQNS